MVLLMCILYFLGNMPNSISPILFTFNLNMYTYSMYVFFANVILFSSHGSYIFFYYAFNNSFRLVLNRLFKPTAIKNAIAMITRSFSSIANLSNHISNSVK
jgi:hypothetical protein